MALAHAGVRVRGLVLLGVLDEPGLVAGDSPYVDLWSGGAGPRAADPPVLPSWFSPRFFLTPRVLKQQDV